ncbi:MAG: hypothetical protein WAU60_02370 [Candidatus Competibacter denitrificans]|uniref:Transmembrane protein n=1 Tax=Candidatus Competibacter denitrificans Run_A_D11 TaxID=1400863 RepID=W6M1T3_9GAMM|nr:hypothetical protein [Candidatus Competibacter denitrificans]CDI01396.1 conserved hypothetical protein [Candidatus Competibacter denitrificans Run_A_D11]HAS85601.1 hypothetical protein [Candidatus Competibacteraceae bacterium]HRC69231.1 hypothetical protein [Candidatus Competibacter denitrificans]
MEPASWWEILLGGLAAILVVLWFQPGVKAAIERSRVAKKDWPAALIPLALVVLFVLLLIRIVRV